MDEKSLKRRVRDVWAELRRERRARAKLLSSTDLLQSADSVTEIAAKFRVLADDARAMEGAASEVAASDDTPSKAKTKAKKSAAKKTGKAPVSAKAAKKKKKRS